MWQSVLRTRGRGHGRLLLLIFAPMLVVGCERGVSIAKGDAGVPMCGDDEQGGAEQCDGRDLDGQDCQDQGFDDGELGCTPQCRFDLTGCTGGCGNLVVEGTEQCDGSALGSWDCWTAAQHTAGELACAPDCQFDTSACHSCGDGVREGPELCDGAQLNNETCQTQGFALGDLACDAACQFDTGDCRGPASCGDGLIDAGEDCDGSAMGGADCVSEGFGGGTLGCSAICEFEYNGCIGGCGNAVVETSEQCDTTDLAGNDCASVASRVAGDLECAPDCTFDVSDCHTCGDGIIEGPEDCDGVALGGADCVSQGYVSGTLGCTMFCSYDVSGCEGPVTCGNGVLDPLEECDGNLLGGQSCPSLGYAGGSLLCGTDCRFDQSGCTHSICALRTPQNPEGRPPLQAFTVASRDLQIAVPQAAAVQDAGPVNPQPAQAAVTFEQLATGTELAGFVVSRAPVAANPLDEAVALIQALPSAVITAADTLSPGSPIVSHDGFDTVVSVTVRLQTNTNYGLVPVRNRLLAQWLVRNLQDFTFPSTTGPSADDFIVSFAVVWRSASQVVITGALATTADYQASPVLPTMVDDAANGSGLARSAAQRAATCPGHVLEHLPRADIIWVLDETGSMIQELTSISTNAVTFFNEASAYGLDFRMGVVNVQVSNNGVFCTGANQSADHFLGPGELARFQDCVVVPSGGGTPATGYEHGITQGYNAIVSHLPRAATNNRVRPNALLAIIYVTDERAQEVSDNCPAPIQASCVQTQIAPTVTELTTPVSTAPDSRAYAITGPPPASCTGAMLGTGYIEVVNAVGGAIHSICQADMGPPMMLILEDIIAASSPILLGHRPISASLAAAKEDNSVVPPQVDALARARANGFDYRASSNGLVFINQSFAYLPYDIVVSYEYWLNPERCDNQVDDDGDNLVDCLDTVECAGQSCGPRGLLCSGSQCLCPGGQVETACGDGADNDCDGLVDCNDTDCLSPVCGNGTAECSELCDTGDLRGQTCDTLGYGGGNLGCSGSCTFDLGGCGALGSYFWDDFEDAADTTAQWTFSGDWERGVPTAVGGEPAVAHQGSYVVATNVGGVHANNRTYNGNRAVTRSINLLVATAPQLTFWAWYDIESNWDGFNVWVSTNGGANYLPLANPTPAYSGFEGGYACWYGSAGWHQVTVDLTAYAGDHIRLGFALFSDQAVANPGAYIDEVHVAEPGVLP